jgi:long-chain acyl-CoA synthetase
VIFPHYWGDSVVTAAVKREGWLYTGDLGCLDADGFLRITDRKKDILVTSSGENVAPQKLEVLLRASPVISEAVVLGDGRPYLCALIVPDLEQISEYAKSQGISYNRPEDLMTHPKIEGLMESVIAAKNEGLAPFERIMRFRIIPQGFSQAGGELTPTLKVKRRVVLEKYQELIQAMYRT